MTRKSKTILFISLLITVAVVFFIGEIASHNTSGKKEVVRVGYFPNMTHAPALVGMSRGVFQKELGEKVKIEAKIFNAGPSEIEALFADAIDIGYIGPAPAINGYLKSKGEVLKIISGAVSGGASLVVQPELFDAFQQEGVKAFIGKKIASPQQGNTQDVSLRRYLQENNLFGKAEVVPIANADQLTMFSLKQIDGAWAPEPWASRLIVEAGGKRLIDERDLWPDKKFCTTNIIVSRKFLEKHSDLVRKWLKANVEVINWLNENKEEAQRIVNAEIEKLTTKKIPEEVLKEAWERLNFTTDPLQNSVFDFARAASELGFLGETEPDLSGIYDLTILNEITSK